MNITKNFHNRLSSLMSENNVTCRELALWLNVDVPMVNRWLNGASAPDVYQFRQIARFFGMPYEWFLDYEDAFPSAAELADRLGLSRDTVECLMDLADTENEDVLEALDDVVYAATNTVHSVYKGIEQAINDAMDEARGTKK